MTKSKKTLSSANLVSLGADELADIIMELVEGDTAAKRLVRSRLIAAAGPAELAREVRKRLATISRSTSFIEWNRVQAVASDLDVQRKLIVEKLSPTDPKLAVELLFKLIDLAPGIYDRADDSRGTISSIFRLAIKDIGSLLPTAQFEPVWLAEEIFERDQNSEYGEYDNLLEVSVPALGDKGLLHLKEKLNDILKAYIAAKQAPSEALLAQVEELAKEKLQQITRQMVLARRTAAIATREVDNDDADVPPDPHFIVLARRQAELELGVVPVDAYDPRRSRLERSLETVLVALGDIDQLLKLNSEAAKTNAIIAFELAEQLFAAERFEEAINILLNCEKPTDYNGEYRPGWVELHANALEKSGRLEDAQTLRHEEFIRSLNETLLQDYIKRLPDFDDEEAEQKALDAAMNHSSASRALYFLLAWPDRRRAAHLVEQRAPEFDGENYTLLTTAAKDFDAEYPLASTILLRSMINWSLEQNRVKRYGYAARHLKRCSELANEINSYGSTIDHTDYMNNLRGKYGRRTSFWSKLK